MKKQSYLGGYSNSSHDLSRGFTLVELLTTVTVAAILLSLAVPSFGNFVRNNRLLTKENDFVTSINLARSEAIRRGNRVTVCKSSDQVSCAGSGGWDQGWIVFVDVNDDGVVTAPDTNVLRVHDGLTGNLTLNGDAALASYISYVSTGATRKIGGGISDTQSGMLVLCDDRGFVAEAKAIQISSTGRVSAASATSTTATSCTP